MDQPDSATGDPVQSSWPELTCWGCGPANEEGLQLKSYVGEDGESLVATVDPEAKFNSGTPNVMYGGHIASLVDCHSVWTAITFAHEAEERDLGSDPRIPYVTSELCVDYHRPTPLDEPIKLVAWVDGEIGRRTDVRCRLGPEGSVTATAEVEVVRVDADAFGGHHQG